MTERERVGNAEWQIRDVKDSPVDPPKAPAVSLPVAEGHHPPCDRRNDTTEALKVFAVLGLCAIGLVLFLGLMAILHTINVL